MGILLFLAVVYVAVGIITQYIDAQKKAEAEQKEIQMEWDWNKILKWPF